MQDTISQNGEPLEVELETPDFLVQPPTSALDITSAGIDFDAASIAKEYAWQKSPVPLWSDILSALKSYEAKYHTSSSVMYDSYLSRTLNVYISGHDLREWVDAYLLYGK